MASENKAVQEVWYRKSWGNIHLISGGIFSLIFILGAFMLNDLSYLLYLILTAGIIYQGYVRNTRPYLKYTHGSIEVYGNFGEKSRTYSWGLSDELKIKNGRIFLNGKKLRFNDWFVSKADYSRMLDFYGSPANDSELLDN